MPPAGASTPGEGDALLGGHDEPVLWLYTVEWGLVKGAEGGPGVGESHRVFRGLESLFCPLHEREGETEREIPLIGEGSLI